MPEMVKFEVEGFKCERCKHMWVPRNTKDIPRVCPRCKSPYWDRKKIKYKG